MRHAIGLRMMLAALLAGGALLPVTVSIAQQSEDGSLLPPPPMAPDVDQNGVDVISGQATYEKTFLSIGPDGPMGLQWKYLLANGERSNFYSRWNSFVGASIFSANAQLGSISGSMKDSVFLDGIYLDPSSGSNTMTLKDGTILTFGQNVWYNFPDETTVEDYSLITSIAYPNGVRWNFYHDVEEDNNSLPQHRLKSVVSNTGFQIFIEYNSNNISAGTSAWLSRKRAIAINNSYEYCNPMANVCSVSTEWDQITFSGNSTITDPKGNVWQYAGGIKSPLSPSKEVAYNYSQVYKVNCDPFHGGTYPNCGQTLSTQYESVTQAIVNGVSHIYSYSTASNGTLWRVTRTGPDGATTYESRRGRPGVTKMTDPLGRIWQFTYTNTGQLLTARHPEGNWVEYVLDNRANRIQTIYHPKSGATSTIVQTFPSCGNGAPANKICNQPSAVTDARGSTTNYTYSTTHGGMLTEVGPAVNGVSPAKKFGYVQRYAWVKNSSGNYVKASGPIWLLSEVRQCKTSALNTSNGTCSAGSGDLIVTTYDYGPDSGPNNLLLRGVVVTADGQTQRTCYGYDKKGNKVSETQPNANLASCS